MIKDNSTDAFFALIRAGLWEQKVTLSQFGEVNYAKVLRIAEEQSVVGLVAAGLEHVKDEQVPKEVALQFVGQALQLEQQNTAMNGFISVLVEKMQKADIYTILVKGQGVAQCYERPLWRSCGDVDLLLSEDNYKKAKQFLVPLACDIENEKEYERHLGMSIDSWVVELHGNLRTGISNRIDKGLDEIQRDVFFGGNVRSWINDGVYVFLPNENNDILFIFTHILQHFYKGGIGLRQICDWCRILWMYKDTIDKVTLEKRIRKMGIMTEWKTFALLAVNNLGMDKCSMPLYSEDTIWRKKAKKVLKVILKTGNMGHNRDMSYQHKDNLILRKLKTFGFLSLDSIRHLTIFPLDSIKAWWNIAVKGAYYFIHGLI